MVQFRTQSHQQAGGIRDQSSRGLRLWAGYAYKGKRRGPVKLPSTQLVEARIAGESV
jgi:hypothetical protein